MGQKLRILVAFLVFYVVLDLVLSLMFEDEHPSLFKALYELVDYELGHKQILIALLVALVAGYVSYRYIKC